ncbi:MAG TPA: SDR family NAD(P)-dependent oxidoreductase [Candidatus Paceibacterota bacterium]
MKIALITGIGKGIGKALAEKFLREDYFVIGAYYKVCGLEHKNLKAFELDLSDPVSVENCSKRIADLHKGIDIFINNAGVLVDEGESKVVVKKLRETLEINLIGTIDFTERLLPDVNRGGHIINISSRAGSLELATKLISHFPGRYPSYKISKAAINMYTITLSNRLKDKDIIVSSIHPGRVKTGIGGADADISPEEAAESIYKFAVSKPETGRFWFNGERVPW